MASALTSADRTLLDLFSARSEDMRQGGVALARLGIAWRRAEPDRAAEWIGQLESHPFYKAGQVAFDLFEWEDFMLDGDVAATPTLPILPAINQFLSGIDGMQELPEISMSANLPPLEPGFYLYRDVVLGLLWLSVQAAEETGMMPVPPIKG